MLLIDARISFTNIAKFCKVSSVSIINRFNNLKNAGIIRGEIIRIIPSSLGYNCIGILGITTSIGNINKVINFLKSKPYFSNITPYSGKFQIRCFMAFYNIRNLNKMIQEVESCPFIQHVETLLWSDTIKTEHPENLIIPPLRNRIKSSIHNEKTIKDIKFDELDRKITLKLLDDARKPFSKIAEELDISTNNVISRYRRLNGTLFERATIILDLQKLGFNAVVNLYINVTNTSKINSIIEQLLEIPNLVVTIRYLGPPYDLFAVIPVKDFKQYFEMHERISKINGVKNVSINLENYKIWPFKIFEYIIEKPT